MDWVGNAGHGVRLPYNYLSRAQWQRLWAQTGLEVDRIEERLGLYPRPASWLFERGLHFIARLRPEEAPPAACRAGAVDEAGARCAPAARRVPGRQAVLAIDPVEPGDGARLAAQLAGLAPRDRAAVAAAIDAAVDVPELVARARRRQHAVAEEGIGDADRLVHRPADDLGGGRRGQRQSGEDEGEFAHRTRSCGGIEARRFHSGS